MNCYVVNPNEAYELPKVLNKENTLFFPEQSMSTQECFTTTRPRDFHIVTNSVFLVGLYTQVEVFIWDKKKGVWVNPELQTYGASYLLIMMQVFGYTNTIPQSCISRKECTNCMGSKIKQE